MSYRIYTTPGLIFKWVPIREVDCLLSVFTYDLGLITVKATGFFRPAAKMRGHVRPFVYSRVSFIKGRAGWRLVGAESYGLTESLIADREVCAGLERLFRLLNRLLMKEVMERPIFSDLSGAVMMAIKDDSVAWSDLEVALVVRWLYYLGYLPDHDSLRPYLELVEWEKSEFFRRLSRPRDPLVIKLINRSLRASGL